MADAVDFSFFQKDSSIFQKSKEGLITLIKSENEKIWGYLLWPDLENTALKETQLKA